MSKKICILGASINQGHWDKEKGGWVNRLNIYLMSKAEKFVVSNLGVSGNTSTDILARMESELKVRNPDTIIVNFGGNDSATVNGKSQVDIDILKKNVLKMIKIAKKFTSEIIIVSAFDADEIRSTPVSWRKELYYCNEDIDRYREITKTICAEEKVIFLSMKNLFDKEDIYDGLHPNAEGHEKIFQRVKNCLEENKII